MFGGFWVVDVRAELHVALIPSNILRRASADTGNAGKQSLCRGILAGEVERLDFVNPLIARIVAVSEGFASGVRELVRAVIRNISEIIVSVAVFSIDVSLGADPGSGPCKTGAL